MGKKSLKILILVMLVVSSSYFCSNTSKAYDKRVDILLPGYGGVIELIEKENVEIEGRHYEYIRYCRDTLDKRIRICSLTTKEDVLVIPSRVDGEPVVEVGSDERSDNHVVLSDEGNVLNWQNSKEQVLKKIVVSEGIKQVVYDGFQYTSAKCIELPKSMKNIGYGMTYSDVFHDCRINHVIIKGTKTNIGARAFMDSKMKKISFPKNYQGKIDYDAFQNSTLEEFKWPSYKSGVSTKIESGTFRNCKKLKKVTFPKNQKHIYIPDTCFYGCTKLKKLTFPASTKKVTYCWTPYADNYKTGPGILEFKGKKTIIAGAKTRHKSKWKVVTVGKIIAPKNSKALAYAKKAKRVKWFAKRIKTDIERYTGPGVNYVDEEYNSDYIKLVKMKYSILKK